MTENIKEPTRAQGVIMFIILLLAYISFASNWLIGSSLSGQITHHFFRSNRSGKLLNNHCENLC